MMMCKNDNGERIMGKGQQIETLSSFTREKPLPHPFGRAAIPLSLWERGRGEGQFEEGIINPKWCNDKRYDK
jgi:hypothetical protein